MAEGYSGTTLAKKLGIKNNFKISLFHQPEHYFSLFTDLPQNIIVIDDKTIRKNMIHYFTYSVAELEKDMLELRNQILENGAIWVSWHKKTSDMISDVTENNIRDIALRNELVDVKVCAIDDIWSGLKLVIRLNDRS